MYFLENKNTYFFCFVIKFKELQNIKIGDKMQNFSEYVNTLKRKIKFSKEETIFVCIGSRNVVWDSIGPYVGSLLKKKIGEEYVVGDLKNNVCSRNDLMYYYPKLKNKFVVAIDSAVSSIDLHGQIFVTERPIIMGLGVNRNKGIVGDIGIKVGSELNLSDGRYVEEMANVVVDGILCCSPFGDGS